MTMHAIANRHRHTVAEALTTAEREVLEFLLPLSPDYPGIERWFTGKVVPGLRSGSRCIVRHDRYGQIAALGIAKAEMGETKICTVRIAPEFAGRGMGIRVFDELTSWLGTRAVPDQVAYPEFLNKLRHSGYRNNSIA